MNTDDLVDMDVERHQIAKHQNDDMPVCDWCKEGREDINDMSGMDLCSDCFSDGGYSA
jgi:hypothetical protein